MDAFQCRLVDGLFSAGAEDVDEAGSGEVSCGFGGVDCAGEGVGRGGAELDLWEGCGEGGGGVVWG